MDRKTIVACLSLLLASCAPRNARLLLRTTFSMYVPVQTMMVSPVLAAITAAPTVEYPGSLQLVPGGE